MALINCPECNKEVSDKAAICPNCGFGVAKYVIRQNKIKIIQEEAEKEAYLYVKRKKIEEKEKIEREKRAEEDRKNSIYDEAVNKYSSKFSKDVEEAEELFSTISSWKDSAIYLKNCKDRIGELRQKEIIKKKKRKKNLKKGIIIATLLFIPVMILVGINKFKLYQEKQRISKARSEFVSSIQGEYVYADTFTFQGELTVSGENIKLGKTSGFIQEVDGDIFYVEWTNTDGSTKKERFKRKKNGDGYNLIYSNSELKEDREYIKQ